MTGAAGEFTYVDWLERELNRLRAHEERRHRGRLGRLAFIDEHTWLDSLDDREQARQVRELNAVDRAADAGRRAREAA